MEKASKNSRNSKTRRAAHFDEQNLCETNHPPRKDYGLLSINESKTPYPRKGDPVDASQLRERLMAVNKGSIYSMSYLPSDIDLIEDISPSTSSNVSTPVKGESFYAKRKKFYASEFIFAKQRLMSNEIHLPGDSASSSARFSEVQSPFEGRRFTR